MSCSHFTKFESGQLEDLHKLYHSTKKIGAILKPHQFSIAREF